MPGFNLDPMKMRARLRRDKKVFLFLFGAEFQDVSRLAIQGPTKGGEGGKPDGPGQNEEKPSDPCDPIHAEDATPV